MQHRKPTRTAALRARTTLLLPILATAAALITTRSAPKAMLHRAPASSLITAAPARPASQAVRPQPLVASPPGEADGAVPDGATFVHDEIPAVARLDTVTPSGVQGWFQHALNPQWL